MNATEGEWIAQHWVRMKGQGDVPTEIVGSGVYRGRSIATLNFDTKDPELSSEKVIANGKLICAAKEMLECLIAIRQSLINVKHTPSESTYQINITPELVANLSKAIDKATK